MQVAVSRIHHPVTTLGPGRRVGLWFQGCSIRCPGCISVDTWEADLGTIPLRAVMDRLGTLADMADGLTVSGGEPFEQPEALAAVLRHWRVLSATSVLVFTGRELDGVSPWLKANDGLIDGLMTGPFLSDTPQTLALRGSDNQRLHVLTPLGGEFAAFDRIAYCADRKLDIVFDHDGDAWLAGIPARGDLGRLRRLLAANGHSATTSDTFRINDL